MCGIAGCLTLDGQRVPAHTLDQMVALLRHRGPDDEGGAAIDPASGRWASWRPVDDGPHGGAVDGAAPLVLGHARLAILDTTAAGRQPMRSRDGTLWVVYNGELYNFIEVRQDLQRLGVRFETRTDTEVLLAAYQQWGESCVERFNGMWAFALWDQRRRALVCSRDRFGVKPFYYHWNGRRFVFASELKALLAFPGVPRRPDPQAVFHYLSSGFGYTDVTPATFFEEIVQLPPGSILTLHEGRLDLRPFWELPWGTPRREPADTQVETLRQLLTDAVRIRLRADVTMGSTLSGGLDSSTVTSLALAQTDQRPWHTFSACFDDPAHDERRHAAALTSRPDVAAHPVFPDPQRCWRELPAMLWHLEEPFPHLNVFSLWLLMEQARRSGVKVILNGHGGDEGLAGYRKDSLTMCAELLQRGRMIRWLREASALKRHEGVSLPSTFGTGAGLLLRDLWPVAWKDALRRSSWYRRTQLGHLQPRFARTAADFLHPPRRQASLTARAAEIAYRVYPIPAWLHYEDRISMAFGVESRSPFLDYRVAEFLMSVPAELKIRRGMRKWILREAVKGIVPESIRLRQDKQGFPTPSETWFRSTLREPIRQLLSSSRLAERGYLEPTRLLELFDRHCEGKANLRFAIWSWVNLELWCRLWCDGPVAEPPAVVRRPDQAPSLREPVAARDAS